jgi:integrase
MCICTTRPHRCRHRQPCKLVEKGVGVASSAGNVILKTDSRADRIPRLTDTASALIQPEGSSIRTQRARPNAAMSRAFAMSEWAIDSWLPIMATRVKPSTLHSYRRNLEIHVLPTLGGKKLQEVTPVMLNKLYANLSSPSSDSVGLSAKTVSYIHTIIHKALGDTVDADLLIRNPAERSKPPRPGRNATNEIQSWDPSELAGFLRVTGDLRLGPIWRLAAMTGMRRGEVLGLRWSDIDLDAARLAVRHAVVAVGYEVIESTPKSHNARVVDLDTETVSQLREHKARQRAERTEWGADYEDHDLVVAKENGTPIHPHTFSQSFERIITSAGLRRIRLHDLRHTHASLALKAGVPVKVISERLGHESPAFTLKQYAHVIPGMQAEAAAQIAALIDGPHASA